MSAYSDLVLSHGANAYWRLNEPSGTTAADSAGTRTGTLAGTGTVLGVTGRLAGELAMSFDGNGRILPASRLSLGTAFTFEAWVQPTAAPGSNPYGLFAGDILTDGDYQWYWSTTHMLQLVYFSGTLNIYNVLWEPALGTWVHVVTTGGGGQFITYLNGVAQTSQAVAVIAGAGLASPAVAGDSQAGAGGWGWKGALQDMAVYPRALTPAEILNHYTVGSSAVVAVPSAGCDHTTVWSKHLATLSAPTVESERAYLATLYGEPGGTDFSTLVSRYLQAITCGTAVAPPAAPTLSLVSPNTGTQGTMVTVTLTGTGFIAGATGVTVNGVGISVVNIQVLSQTSLTADLAIAADAPPTARSITVSTAGGSASQAFTVAVPATPWGRIQSAQATVTAAATISVTLPAPVAIGNGVLVALASNTGAPSGFAAATCTDSHGHTYLKALGQQDGLGIGSVTLFYCPKTTATGASSVITLTPGVGAQDFLLTAIEVGGVGNGLAVDVSFGGGGISTTVACTTSVPTAALLLGLSAMFVRSAEASLAVSTPDGMTPGWVQEGEALAFGAGGAFAGEADSRALTAATAHSLQVTWTLPTSGWWAGALVGFKTT